MPLYQSSGIPIGERQNFFSKKTGQSRFPDFLSGKTGLYYFRITIKKNYGKDEFVMKKRLLMISAAAALLLSGCNDYVGKEKSHPLFVKAAKEKSAGAYREAARCYEEFLLICPKSSLAHNELGNLYSDYLNDPLKGVYHYGKWMEMNPNDQTNFEAVRVLADTARKNLYKNLQDEFKDSAEAKQAAEEMQRLRDQVTQLQNSLNQSEEQNRQMKETLNAIKAEREKLNAQTAAQNRKKMNSQPAAGKAPEKDGSAKAAASKKSASASAQTSAAGKTYTVQPGDNLSKISRKCYGTAKYYRLIAEANSGKVGSKMQVRAGQVLVIPPLPKR